eukprot:SAG31_NODE_2303_length_5975_cov_2.694860_1_plen_677_part_00
MTAQMDPGAFFVLLLLSKLLPSVAQPNTDLSALAEVVQCFGAHHYYRCRKAAAAALAPLVPEASVCTKISGIVENMVSCTCHNQLHGSVLQIHCLLQTCSVTSAKFFAATALIEPTMALLKHSNCNYVVQDSVLDMLAYVTGELKKKTSFSDTDHQILARMHIAVVPCIQESFSDSPGAMLGYLRMRMRAVELWEMILVIRHRQTSDYDVCMTSLEDLTQNTTIASQILHDNSAEMQIVGIKLLKRLLRMSMGSFFDVNQLRSEVIQLGGSEKRSLVLKNLCSLSLHLRYTMTNDVQSSFWHIDGKADIHLPDVLPMWTNVVQISQDTNETCAAQGLRFMGMTIEAGSSGMRDLINELSAEKQCSIVARLKPWVDMIVRSSDPSKLSTIRGACVDSMEYARWLLDLMPIEKCSTTLVSGLTKVIVTLWSVIIQLMQDEIEEIREAAASLAWKLVKPVRKPESQQPLASMVYKDAVDHLGEMMLTPQYTKACLEHFCAQLRSQSPTDASTGQPSKMVAVTLFEKEDDNQFAEEMFSAQVHAAALNRWCLLSNQSVLDDSVVRRIRQLVEDMFADLQHGCTIALAESKSACGLGGIGTNASVFIELHRLSIGVAAVAPLRAPLCISKESVEDAIGSLVDTCALKSCHPILFAAMEQAQRSWSAGAGETLPLVPNTVWV